jgi:hypothetical protein
VEREGYKLVNTLPESEACVGILNFRDRVIVATSKGVYEMIDEKLCPIPFVVPNDD